MIWHLMSVVFYVIPSGAIFFELRTEVCHSNLRFAGYVNMTGDSVCDPFVVQYKHETNYNDYIRLFKFEN